MMTSQPEPCVDVAEYLRLERLSDKRHQFIDGVIVPVLDEMPAHSLITANITALSGPARRAGYIGFLGARVCVDRRRQISYPDLTFVYGKPEYLDDERDAITNPRVIVEVLSPYTRDLDRGTKSVRYRALPSVAEYLLIEQTPVDIEHYVKLPDGRWTVSRIMDENALIRLESIGCDLPVSEIYEGYANL